MISFENNGLDLRGVSTDEKPLDVNPNTIFKELDTGEEYFFNGATWEKVGGGNV